MSRLELAAFLFLAGSFGVGCSGEGTMIPATNDAGPDVQQMEAPTANATGNVLQKPVHIASSFAYYRGLQEAYLPGMQ
jgi:hypothetical protein